MKTITHRFIEFDSEKVFIEFSTVSNYVELRINCYDHEGNQFCQGFRTSERTSNRVKRQEILDYLAVVFDEKLKEILLDQ